MSENNFDPIKYMKSRNIPTPFDKKEKEEDTSKVVPKIEMEEPSEIKKSDSEPTSEEKFDPHEYSKKMGISVPKTDVGGLEATARLFGQGLTYNQMEEIIAALKTGKKIALGEAKLSQFPELYREEEKKQEDIMKGIKEESPYLSMVPEFIGAAVSPVNKLLFPAATLARLGKAISPAAKIATEQLVTKAPLLEKPIGAAKYLGTTEVVKGIGKGAISGGIGGAIAGIGASEYGIEDPAKLAESSLEYAKTGTAFGGLLGGAFGGASAFIKASEAPVTEGSTVAGTAFKKGFQGKGLITREDKSRILQEQEDFAREQAKRFTFGEESPITQVQKEMKNYFDEGDYKHWENVVKQKLPNETEEAYIRRIEKEATRKYTKPEPGEIGEPKLENDSEYAERLKEYAIRKNLNAPSRPTDLDNTTMSNLVDIVQDLENAKELKPKDMNFINMDFISTPIGKGVKPIPLAQYLKLMNPSEYNKLVQNAKDYGMPLEKYPEFQYLLLGNKITNRDKDVISLAPQNDIREFLKAVNDFYSGKMSPTDEHNFGRWVNGEQVPGLPELTSTKLTDILSKYPKFGENIKNSARQKLTELTGKSADELFEKFKDVRRKTGETFINKALPEDLAGRLIRDSERIEIERDVYKAIDEMLSKLAYSSGKGTESLKIVNALKQRTEELNRKYGMNFDVKDFINKAYDIAGQNAAYYATHSMHGDGSKSATGIVTKLTDALGYGGLNVLGRIGGTPVTVTRAVYNAADNNLIPLAQKLQGMPPPLSFMGDALKTGIENKSGKNAALFMILQNPESRQIAKDFLGATEDQSEK